MKPLLIITFMISFLYSSAPKQISYVDPKSFSGLWYEIARTYNSFEENCVAATVEYVLKKSNQYKVFNRCFENQIGGNLIEYKGKAVALEDNSMSRLKKTYYWIFSEEYKVIYLNDYKSAVIANDDMQYVWIMSRTPKMSNKEFKEIIALLDDYMNTKDLIITPQDDKGRYK